MAGERITKKVTRNGKEITYEVISKGTVDKANSQITTTMSQVNRSYQSKAANSKKSIQNIVLNA